MPIVVTQTLQALCAVTQRLPVGTNLALLHFLWMLVTGMLLPSRGALFPALQAMGLPTAAVRRAWAAFRYGAWDIAPLLSAWEQYVSEQDEWRPRRYAGYVPKAVDLTAFWRPQLRLSITHIFSIMLKGVRLPSHQIEAGGDTNCLRNSIATILPGQRKNSPWWP